MPNHDKDERYGAVSRFFHWSIALLILSAIPLGLTAANIGPNSHDPELAALREGVLFWHKSIGLLVLTLALGRLIWAIARPRPDFPSHLSRTERIAAKGVHYTLYVLMIGMPASGIVLSQGVGFPVSFFGLFTVPDLIRPDLATPILQRPSVMLGFILHKRVLAYGLFAVLALHILGLLKHQWIDRDPSIWRRMAPGFPRRRPKGTNPLSDTSTKP